MSDATIGWIISGIVGFVGLIGGIIARDRQVANQMANQIKMGDDTLHARINEVRDQYVKGSELDKQLSRIDSSVRDLRSDMKEHTAATNDRLDKLIVAIGSRRDQ